MINEGIQRLFDKLISIADSSRQGEYLEQDRMFDSVHKLSNSVMGGKPLADTMKSILTPYSKRKIEGILEWLETYVVVKSHRVNRSIEAIIPFQLASIAGTVGSVTWFVRNPLANVYFIFMIMGFVVTAWVLTLNRKNLSSESEDYWELSLKAKSLQTNIGKVDTSQMPIQVVRFSDSKSGGH